MRRDSGPEDGEALFERLVARFSADPAVTPPEGGRGGKFGASALKVDGKIFAMMVSGGELVLKLPKPRVDDLVASGAGKPFSPGRGRVMREWVTIAPGRGGQWPELAEEARQFVTGRASTPRRR